MRLFSDFSRIIPAEILLLLLILGVIIFVWDLLMRQSSKLQSAGGISEKAEIVALQGSSLLPSRDFFSETLRLQSKPHGLIREGGFLIPVDVIPSSNKIRDRHVVQMLIHLRLIAEAEGKSPPHGILIMGKEQRSVKVKNTEEKQRWLSTILEEMDSIIAGVPALPKPQFFKCKNCDVHALCSHSLYDPKKRTQNEPPESDDQES